MSDEQSSPVSARETKEFVTPIDKIKLTLRTYLTGAESRLVENVYIDGSEVTAGQVSSKLTGPTFDKAQDKLIELIVVSVGESVGNSVEQVLAMKKPDYDAVLAECNAVYRGDDFTKKKAE